MDFISNEPYDAITHKFLLSIPTKITMINKLFYYLKLMLTSRLLSNFALPC